MPDHEGRARDLLGHAERPQRAAHERGLARAELARDEHDVAGPQRGRQRGAGRARSPRGRGSSRLSALVTARRGPAQQEAAGEQRGAGGDDEAGGRAGARELLRRRGRRPRRERPARARPRLAGPRAAAGAGAGSPAGAGVGSRRRGRLLLLLVAAEGVVVLLVAGRLRARAGRQREPEQHGEEASRYGEGTASAPSVDDGGPAARCGGGRCRLSVH